MRKTDKMVNDVARDGMVKALEQVLQANGTEVLKVASNKLAVPFKNELGNEFFFVFTVSVPKGSRDDEAFDGRVEAADFAFRQNEKAKQKAKREAERAKKQKPKE